MIDVEGYLTPLSKMDAETMYDKGRVYAYKSMLNIYPYLRRFFDKTRQQIHFFSYTRKMSTLRRSEEGDYSRGQADAFEEVFNHFKPKRKQ